MIVYNTTKNKIEFVNEFRTILIIVNILSLILIVLYGYIVDKYSMLIYF